MTVIGFFGGNVMAAHPNICTGHSTGTLVRNVQNCSTYFHCFNGNPILTNCPAGQLFNHIINECDLASAVKCFQCPKDQYFTDLPVANECNQFIRCFQGEPEHLTCGPGLAFDRSVQMCNLVKEVKCVFEVLCPPTSVHPIFIRDRTNCSKYFQDCG